MMEANKLQDKLDESIISQYDVDDEVKTSFLESELAK
jgi:hypothetical protein